MEQKLSKFVEFETKYRTDINTLIPFKKIVERLPQHEYVYVQGPDKYFTKKDSPFLRLRVAQYEVDGKRYMQLTSKIKPEERKNNIIRREPNLRLDGNSIDEIHLFINMLGYKYNFEIWKACHIYTFNDATLVFYTVIEENSNKEYHFIEIEVDEETISELTESQAWSVIEKYENILEKVGVNAKKRLKLSLYDMFKKEVL